MKHLFLLLIASSILLNGCGGQQEDTPINREPHYDEVENLHIEWKDLFNQEEDKYYAYVYSVTCTPCSMLRSEMIEFSQKNYVSFYFIYPSEDIPFVDDESLAKSSLGKSSLDDVYIYNTPTLIEITNKVITDYSNDYYEIKSFVESFSEESI